MGPKEHSALVSDPSGFPPESSLNHCQPSSSGPPSFPFSAPPCAGSLTECSLPTYSLQAALGPQPTHSPAVLPALSAPLSPPTLPLSCAVTVPGARYHAFVSRCSTRVPFISLNLCLPHGSQPSALGSPWLRRGTAGRDSCIPSTHSSNPLGSSSPRKPLHGWMSCHPQLQDLEVRPRVPGSGGEGALTFGLIYR